MPHQHPASTSTDAVKFVHSCNVKSIHSFNSLATETPALINVSDWLRFEPHGGLLRQGSCIPCSCAAQDDASGRQQWTFAAVTGGYTITIVQGREGCNDILTAATCTGATALTFAAANDGSGLQVWTVTPPAAPPAMAPYFTNGNYQIVNTARAACTQYLGAGVCNDGNDVFMTTGGDVCPASQGCPVLVYLPGKRACMLE